MLSPSISPARLSYAVQIQRLRSESHGLHEQLSKVRAQLNEASVQEAMLTNQLAQLAETMMSIEKSADSAREVGENLLCLGNLEKDEDLIDGFGKVTKLI